MIINKIVFGNTNAFGPHNNREFCFTNQLDESCKNPKAFTFIIFIGKNGSGKTSILNAIKFCQWVQHNKNKMQPPLKEYLFCKQNKGTIHPNNIKVFYQRKLKKFEMICENIKLNDKNLICDKIKIIGEYTDIGIHSLPPLLNQEFNFDLQLPIIKNNIKIFLLCYLNNKKVLQTAINKLKNKNSQPIVNEIKQIIENENNFKILNNSLELILNIKVPEEQNFFSDDFFQKTTFQILKNNNKLFFDLLSSGEQHIFFILFLLAHKMDECLFVIDEPENSLYPNQQITMVDYFIKKSNELIVEGKNHQFFIATHSPFILKKFLNHSDAVIINVENGENIKKSENKKLLLDENEQSYDEINYLYFDMISSSYYLSLFEKMKTKICLIKRKDEMTFGEIDEWLDEKNKSKKLIVIKCSKKNNNNEINRQTVLVRLRHLLAHGKKNEEEYKYYVDNKDNELFKKEEKTKHFYEKFDNDFEKLLRECVESIRKIIFDLKS